MISLTNRFHACHGIVATIPSMISGRGRHPEMMQRRRRLGPSLSSSSSMSIHGRKIRWNQRQIPSCIHTSALQNFSRKQNINHHQTFGLRVQDQLPAAIFSQKWLTTSTSDGKGNEKEKGNENENKIENGNKIENEMTEFELGAWDIEQNMSPHTLKLAKGLVDQNRVSLARSITLIESLKEEHQLQAQYLLEYVLDKRRQQEQIDEAENGSKFKSFRLAIAGPPGAGKSSTIEKLGTYLVEEKGLRVAVLAIDPSSSRTGGSILGDKTRMENLSKLKNAYVRPSPTRGSLGGVAQHTNDVILLCEAAGYDVVIVETVGLGQSEVLVDETVDMVCLLLPPAGGDELQGVKKGIMEVADLIVINKSDGDLEPSARHAATDIMHALQLQRRKRPAWRPRVKLISALENKGIDKAWEIVEKFKKKMTETGDLADKREKQNSQWMWSQFREQLMSRVKKDTLLINHGDRLEKELGKGFGTPRHAARVLVQEFLARQKQS